MSFSDVPNEIALHIANLLHTADVSSLARANRSLQWLLTPLLYDRTLPPWDDILLYDPNLPQHYCKSRYNYTWNCTSNPLHRTNLQRVLGWASMRGYVWSINHLLDRGATLTSNCYSPRESPLHLVSQSGHIEAAKLLLQRSPLECTKILTDKNHWTSPLDLAAGEGHQDLVKLLIPHSNNTHLLSVLGRAAACNHIGIIDLLLPLVGSIQLHEPLRCAAAHGHTNIVQLILSHVETDHLPTVATAGLEATVKRGHMDVLELLIAAGCKVNTGVGEVPNKTILHWLSEFACWISLVRDQPADNTASILLENGIDAAAADLYGRTPLHLAARHGPHVTRRILHLSKSLSTNESLTRSTTPENVHKSLLELLVRAGGDINARDHYGRTPLHEAAENSDLLTVTLLLDLGAETTLADRQGNTALDLGVGFIRRDGAAAVVCAIRDHELMMERVWEDTPLGQYH